MSNRQEASRAHAIWSAQRKEENKIIAASLSVGSGKFDRIDSHNILIGYAEDVVIQLTRVDDKMWFGSTYFSGTRIGHTEQFNDPHEAFDGAKAIFKDFVARLNNVM